ncbi:MAG: DUF3696 domain-containing protein [Ruminococcus sp.]|jgi:Uncharacterized conserved protein|uniref:DUF3696 domain-containing protein n=1 Tax=Schaedlerella arabinosiphila TaxID=2044587 RepID=A0A426DPW0_9FIRM|nr:DUF3696 domain-containing protein [Schaedlerella arabinosiphila]MCI8722253.1 DUF3696 domain-containing protein [Ruminococcus sp.]RRK34763.1 DUF3696 domain-containing protein [Schaedlerella arabinosiphila]
MHKKLIIENFKCFSEQTQITLGKINICLGSNSVGKSSVIQSCILFRQIYEQAKLFKDTQIKKYNIQLNDIYGLQLGDSEHIKSSKDKEDITLKLDEYEYKLTSVSESPAEMEVKNRYDVSEMSAKKGIFSENFYYLNAERKGPRNYQLIDSKVINNCGVYGENAIHLLNVLGAGKVDTERCFHLDENKKVNTLSKQAEYWMDYIIPGIEMRTDDLMELRISRMSLRQPALDTDFMSPYNFGFGISYVLPVILTGLTAIKGSVFLVENPEAHLHPKGQSHIGYFLAAMACAGIQVIVETHSEHVLNGIRIAALKNAMKPEDISVNFFSIKETNGNVRHTVEKINLNDRMDLESWPEGFLDQEEEDLRTLRELRRNCL